MTTARFICTLHSEVRGDVRNLASLLRVTCVLFLHQQAVAAQSMLEPMRARA